MLIRISRISLSHLLPAGEHRASPTNETRWQKLRPCQSYLQVPPLQLRMSVKLLLDCRNSSLNRCRKIDDFRCRSITSSRLLARERWNFLDPPSAGCGFDFALSCSPFLIFSSSFFSFLSLFLFVCQIPSISSFLDFFPFSFLSVWYAFHNLFSPILFKHPGIHRLPVDDIWI